MNLIQSLSILKHLQQPKQITFGNFPIIIKVEYVKSHLFQQFFGPEDRLYLLQERGEIQGSTKVKQ